MKRLRGRKINDLAFEKFLKILEFVAKKKGKVVSYISRCIPSSKTCSKCNHVLDKLPIEQKYWVCPSCGAKHGRDANASYVIHRVGASTLRLGDVSQPLVAISEESLESLVL